MLLRSQIDMAELHRIINDVSRKTTGGNLKHEARFENVGRDGALVIRFTLHVADSFGKGARTAASGRHMPKASWQAHRDVMRAIFASDPDAVLKTALATYKGRSDFERNFERTGDQNCGSQMFPKRIRDCAV